MGGLERYGTLPLGSAVCHRRFTLAGSRRGGRVAEGTRLLSEYGDQTPSRVRIPPSPSIGTPCKRVFFGVPDRRLLVDARALRTPRGSNFEAASLAGSTRRAPEGPYATLASLTKRTHGHPLTRL